MHWVFINKKGFAKDVGIKGRGKNIVLNLTEDVKRKSLQSKKMLMIMKEFYRMKCIIKNKKIQQKT